jgi:hypothetical protein
MKTLGLSGTRLPKNRRRLNMDRIWEAGRRWAEEHNIERNHYGAAGAP